MIPNNKCFCFLLALIFVSTGMLVTTADLTASNTKYKTLYIEYDYPAPAVEHVNIDSQLFDRITINDLPNSCVVGEPRLPVQPLKLLIPYGCMVESITVDVHHSTSLGHGYNVEKGQNIIPITASETYKDTSIQKLVSSNQQFTIVGTYIMRGYTVLFLNLHPVHYNEYSGEIIWNNHMTIQIKTQPTLEPKSLRNTQKDKHLISTLVDNPSVVATYDDAPTSVPLDTVEYVIITNEDLKNATGTYTFQDLVAAKQDQGMTAAIYTVEEIITNPDYWVNGAWGDNNPSNPFYYGEIQGPIAKFNDTQARIRNFIRYAYTELSTEYVLLGGDADYTTSDNIVPVRELFAVEDGLPLGSRDLIEEDIPSDIYYACLDGNFNRDGDNHWGENETQNGYNDEDEADLLSEVYVGRACVDADDEVSNFVMKTLAYDASTDPYIYTALMVGEYLGFPGVSAYGGNYKDLIIPLIPEEFDVDTLYDRDGTWSKSQLMNRLNTNTPHLINHLGHGNVQYALKMNTNDIASLTNDKYFFVYSQTCLAGSFDNSGSDCAAEYFTVETPHGAFAVIMNARYGLGSENTLYSPSQVLDESFFTAIFTEHLHALGQANHYSKEDHIWHINENGIRWVYYETNLFGDPSLRIKPYNSPPNPPSTPQGPDSGRTTIAYTFSATTTDPEGEDIYIMFDWGDGTTSDWIGPQPSGSTISESHTWVEAGTFLVKARAKDVEGGKSSWSTAHDIIIESPVVIDIRTIGGKLGHVTVNIKNTGLTDASNVNWSIALDGGLILLGKTSTGTIPQLHAGVIADFQSKFIIGFGKPMVTVTIKADDEIFEKTVTATIMLFIVANIT